jgi:proteasome assembly chaperone (PAC2) family protein
MNFLQKAVAVTNSPIKLYRRPDFIHPAIVLGWNGDISKTGTKITDYLNTKLKGEVFGEIEPFEFFPFRGITIEDDLIQFPESKFFSFPGNDLVIFKSDAPTLEWNRFLNLVLDTAENYCHAKELYAVGGMISLGAHSNPREIMATFNSKELKGELTQYNISAETNFETPTGQSPTFNSCLLWAGQRRNIPCVTLWVAIPFYLATVGDPKAQKILLDFFNKRFNLGLDLSDLDEEIRQQNVKIFELRNRNPEVDAYINKLESNTRLTDDESQDLIAEMERFLGEKD